MYISYEENNIPYVQWICPMLYTYNNNRLIVNQSETLCTSSLCTVSLIVHSHCTM